MAANENTLNVGFCKSSTGKLYLTVNNSTDNNSNIKAVHLITISLCNTELQEKSANETIPFIIVNASSNDAALKNIHAKHVAVNTITIQSTFCIDTGMRKKLSVLLNGFENNLWMIK